MAVIDILLAVVLLILLFSLIVMYSKNQRKKTNTQKESVRNPKTPKQTTSPVSLNHPLVLSEYQRVLSEYQPLADAIASTLGNINVAITTTYLQSLEDTYLAARYSPESAAQVRKMIEEKKRSLGEYYVTLKEQAKKIDSLKPKNIKDDGSIFNDKTMDYLGGANNNMSEALARMEEIFTIISKGLDDLELNGPIKAKTYRSVENASDKVSLRSQVFDSLDEARKFLNASKDTYKELKIEMTRPIKPVKKQ